jgi:hypothetical protein
MFCKYITLFVNYNDKGGIIYSNMYIGMKAAVKVSLNKLQTILDALKACTSGIFRCVMV